VFGKCAKLLLQQLRIEPNGGRRAATRPHMMLWPVALPKATIIPYLMTCRRHP